MNNRTVEQNETGNENGTSIYRRNAGRGTTNGGVSVEMVVENGNGGRENGGIEEMKMVEMRNGMQNKTQNNEMVVNGGINSLHLHER